MVAHISAIILISILTIGMIISFIYNSAMLPFMGSVLIALSLLKIRDLEGFAKAFAKYDILAKRSVTYARAYPYIEFFLGLLFVTGTYTRIGAMVLLALMVIGLIGVTQNQNKNLKCACMGTRINVPLTTLTIVENTIMIIMALAVLL